MFLKDLDLNPRTLGIGQDQPILVPLKEAMSLMDECYGAIILGYPQFEATINIVINEKKKSHSVYLPSPWNHIEAALASTRNLPILIIRHKHGKITILEKGIFDKGITDSTIYTTDLEGKNWFSNKTIKYAFNKWKEKVMEFAFRKIITEEKIKWEHKYTDQSGNIIPEPVEIEDKGLIYKRNGKIKFRIIIKSCDSNKNKIFIDKEDLTGEEPHVRSEELQIISKRHIKGHRLSDNGKIDYIKKT